MYVCEGFFVLIYYFKCISTAITKKKEDYRCQILTLLKETLTYLLVGQICKICHEIKYKDNHSKKKLKKLHIHFFLKKKVNCLVSIRRYLDVYTTSITLKRYRMDVKTTSCAYWVKVLKEIIPIMPRSPYPCLSRAF